MMFWSYYFPHFLLVHVLIAWSCAKAKTKSKTKPKPRHSGRSKAVVYLIIFFRRVSWTGYECFRMNRLPSKFAGQVSNAKPGLKTERRFWICLNSLYHKDKSSTLSSPANELPSFRKKGKFVFFLKDLLIIKCTFFHLM